MSKWIKCLQIATFFLGIVGLLAAESGDVYSNPAGVTCGGIGLVNSTCQIMQTLLTLGPYFAIIALLIAGFIYVYAHMFVSADQRGKYNTLCASLAVGALVLAALVGASGLIIKSGTQFLTAPSA